MTRNQRTLVVLLLLGLLPSVSLYQVFNDESEALFDKRIMTAWSFRAPFYLVRGTIPFWTFGGSAVVTDDFLRLTPESKSSQGYIWGQKALHAEAWEVEFEVKISGHQSVGADGLAFWYIQEGSPTQGPTFGGPDTWNGLGVFIDTFDNDNKGDNPSIGIFYNQNNWKFNMDEDGSNKAAGMCRHYIRNSPTSFKVQYYDNKVFVFLRASKSQTWIPCAKAEDIHLPTGYYFALTAATGGVADNHDVTSFVSNRLIPKGGIPEAQKPDSQQENVKSKLPVPQPHLPARDVEAQDPASKKKSIFDRLNSVQGAQEKQPQQQQVPPQQEPQVPFQQAAVNSQIYPPQTTLQNLLTDVRALQGQYNNLNGAYQQVKKQLESLKTKEDTLTEQYQKIISHQSELAQAIDNIPRGNPADGTDAAFNKKFEEMSAQMRDMKVTLQRDMESRGNDINNLVTELLRNLNVVKGVAQMAKQDQDNIKNDLSKQHQVMQETVSTSSGWGFWTWLLIFQLIGGVGYMYFRRIRDESTKKLY